MPIYEYECKKCKKTFDVVVLNREQENNTVCSECGSSQLKKLVSKVRYMSGPQEDGLAERSEKRMLKSLGGKVSESTRKEIREMSQTAAKRGKKRFENMMDTGKSENVDY